MVFVVFTLVSVSGTLGFETMTLVSEFEKIFHAIGNIVFTAGEIFSVAKAAVPGIGTMVCVARTISPTTAPAVAAAQKMVAAAPPMFRVSVRCSPTAASLAGQSFANPKLVFSGAPARPRHW